MTRITMEEWPQRLTDLGTQVSARWPWLKVKVSPVSGGLDIEIQDGPRMSGSVDLRLEGGMAGTRHMRANVAVGSAPALMGSLSEIEVGVQNYRTLLDALHFCVCQLEGLEIWLADELPCSTCRGTGKTREERIIKGSRKPIAEHVDCHTCGGTGKRKDAKTA
jgi:hypothetical protein